MSLPQEFVDDLRRFLLADDSDSHIFGKSQWIEHRLVKVYARRISKCVASLHAKPIPVLVLASVEVSETRRNRGWFSQILQIFEECAGSRVVYIEQVLIPEHGSIYARRGYTRIDTHALFAPYVNEYPCDFYKKVIKDEKAKT